MKKAIVIAAFVGLIVFAIGAIVHYATLDGLDGYLFAYGSDTEDTVYAPGYSDSGFRRVRLGMSRREVEELIGAPLDVWTNQDSTIGMRWSRSPGDNDHRCRVVLFRAGVVVDKHAEFYVD